MSAGLGQIAADSVYVAEPLEARRLLAFEPNLDIVSVDVEPGARDVGDFLQATVRITNNGDWPAGPFLIRFYLVNRSTGQATFIQDDSVSGLAQGFTINRSLLPGYPIPPAMPQGSYRVRVHADWRDEVNESNEQDNVVGSPTAFDIKQPDLIVTSVPHEHAAYGPGNVLSSVVTVKNQGAASTFPSGPSFQVEYWLGKGNENDYRKIGTGSVGWLAGGATQDDRIDWTLPSNVEPGTFRLCVLADSNSVVPESQEQNNWTCSSEFQIVQPELAVTTVTGVEPFYRIGGSLGVTAHVKNNGSVTAASFQLRYYLGTDSDRTRYELAGGSISILGGGQSREDTFPPKLITGAYEPGLYRVWVHADSGDAIPELNEDDNWKGSAQFRIVHIEDLRWETEAGGDLTGPIDEGTPIYISFQGEGFDTGGSIPVEIWEDDGVDDELERADLRVKYDGARGRWRARWWPAWYKDRASGDPEFYFHIPKNHLGFATGYSSGNIEVLQRTGDFGFQISEHTVGTGIPLVLVHGNNSDTVGKLYRWQWFEDYIRRHPADFAEFDVYLWKHNTSKPIGFNGAAGSQAASLADYINDTLRVGVPGTPYASKRVALLAHSQGGLVARSFMNHQNQGDNVSGLITLGTPHRGSPMAVADWVAAVWEATGGTEATFSGALSRMVNRDGTVNLAWDNLDQAVGAGVHTTRFNPLGKPYDLTRDDMNRPGFTEGDRTPDHYPVSLKNDYGTLSTLNTGESFYHKLVAIGAYDPDLSDNPSSAEFHSNIAAGFFSPDFSSDHVSLGATTRLMGEMSKSNTGNVNGSPYYANDGLVPLQSALFLHILPSIDGGAFSSLNGQAVGIDPALIAAHTPLDMTAHYFSLTVRDHQDILDTTSATYWEKVVEELRLSLETVAPTAAIAEPMGGGVIGRDVLNQRGYIEVTYDDSGGSGLDPHSILDAEPEFMVGGAAAAGVTLTSVQRREGNTYRYFFDGEFAPGQVSVQFIGGSFGDDAGNAHEGSTRSFTVRLDGDANGDGKVGVADYLRIDRGSARGLSGFANGDFNGDGTIDGADYFIIDQAFLAGLDLPAAMGEPEPAQLANEVGEDPPAVAMPAWLSQTSGEGIEDEEETELDSVLTSAVDVLGDSPK